MIIEIPQVYPYTGCMMIRKNGFTLIELIVVIVIIGVLATLGLSSYDGVQKKAKYTKAQTDIRELTDLVIAARLATGNTFGVITGSLCSECACRSGNIKSAGCLDRYKAVIQALNTASESISVDQTPVDSWGNPYLINENEGEGGCYTDNIASAGPDGTYYNADDVIYNLPVLRCSPVLGPHHANTNWK